MTPNSRKLPGLNSLRGIAAIFIVLFHIQAMHSLQLPTTLDFLRNYLGLGVPLFFVISAFSLFLTTNPRVGEDSWLSNYAVRRLMRIVPLFYFMAFAYLFFILVVFGSSVELSKFLWTISLIFNLIPGQHESIVWAGWTVGVEVLFYFLLPYFLISIKNQISAFILLCISLVVSSFFYKVYLTNGYPPGYAYMSFMGSFGIFCFGILGYFIYIKFRFTEKATLYSNAFLLIALGLLAITVLNEDQYIPLVGNRSNLWGPVFMCLIISQCIKPTFLLTNSFFSYAGQLSFGIYLCHAPIVWMLKPVYLWIYAYFSNSWTISFLACCAITLPIVVMVAKLLNYFIEEPGIKLGEKIISMKVFADHRKATEKYGISTNG